MAHARTQIRNAIATKLTGLALTGANVYKAPVYPRTTLPCLAIFDTRETRVEEFDGDKQTRKLEITVQACQRISSDVDGSLDTICQQIETAIWADVTLGGLLIKDIALVETEKMLTSDLEQPAGVASMVWEIYYRVADGDPETLAP
jgi:hypothetical protein